VTATCRPPAEIKRYQESPHFSLKTQIIGIPFKTRKQNVIPHYKKLNAAHLVHSHSVDVVTKDSAFAISVLGFQQSFFSKPFDCSNVAWFPCHAEFPFFGTTPLRIRYVTWQHMPQLGFLYSLEDFSSFVS